jgi:large subunit ribosomal protein L19
MIQKMIDKINRENARKEKLDSFAVGDAVKVHVKIKEGDKERLQVFAGTVIAIKRGGVQESFTVRRISHGVGVEKVFPVNSPHVAKVEVESSSRVRRAKLYFLRDLSGKKARLAKTKKV